MLSKEQLWGSNLESLQPRGMYQSVTERNSLFPKSVIGIDRDGVLTQLSKSPIRNKEQLIPIPEALEAVALLRSKGHKIVIVFDQPEISKGNLTQYEVDAMNTYLLELLGNAGCSSIDAIYFCTSSDKRDMYAKPNSGMFRRAEKEQHLSFKGGYYVGDSIEDLDAAYRIKSSPILINTGNYLETTEKLNTFSKRKLKSSVKSFNSLMEFALWV